MVTTEGGVEGHKLHAQRRWAVRLWNLQVESLVRDDCQVFVNINWGGDREDSRIKTGTGTRWWQILSDAEVVWGMGSDPHCLRSDVMELKERSKVRFDNEFQFEWRGTYAELESQYMELELWHWNRFRANTLDSFHKETLVSYATGPVFQEIQLRRANVANTEGVIAEDKDQAARFRVTFQLYFQEIYDFELNVVDVQATGLLPLQYMQRATASELSRSTGSSIDDLGAVTQSIMDPSDTSEAEQSDEEKIKKSRPLKKLSVNRPHADVVGTLKLKRRVQLEIQNTSLKSTLKRGPMHIRSQLRRVEKGHSSLDRWGNVGKLYYRGTWADLDNDLLYLNFFESKSLDPVASLIAHSAVSLRGVTEYGTASGACAPPAWLLKQVKNRMTADEVRSIMKSSLGRFEAKIAVENQPKYRQSGELCDMVSNKAYLLVRILRVDRIAIPDQRPISQCDSAVQVQFGGNSYETEVRPDSISPQFNQEFYFELKTNSPSDFSPQELATMHGPIVFDVWLRSDDDGALSAEHCGHVEVSLLEIFSEGKPETKLHISIRTGQVTEYRTAVLRARRKLRCLWTDAGPNVNVPASAALPSYLYVDIWLRPFDFSVFSAQAALVAAPKMRPALSASMSMLGGEVTYSDPLLPNKVRTEFKKRAAIWSDQCENLLKKYWAVRNRQFQYLAKSQNRDEHFLPLFLDVIRPPEILPNATAIAFWIHCLSHTSMEELKAAEDFWATPDFTVSLGKGDTFAHAILHCSMLRGLATSVSRPFVCVGTGWDSEPLAWVMTMNQDGSVTIWDTASNRQFRLVRRCADVHRCRRVANGHRAPGQQIDSELVEYERLRRKRLTLQDSFMSKLDMVMMDTIDCDCDTLRAPEILKVVDPEVHAHAMVYSSEIPWSIARCIKCGGATSKRLVQGLICNKRIFGKTSGYDACYTDEKSFLCLSCAASYLPTPSASAKVDPECKFAQQPVLPYKTIDVVFDHTNCWLNLQHFSPVAILYDLWNPDYWHPFTTVLTSFRSFSLASKGLRKARSDEYYDNLKLRILARLQKSIESIRRNANLATFFQKDQLLISHIERGLDLAFRAELVELVSESTGVTTQERAKIETEIERWKLELYSKVPANHKYVGHTFLFSFADAAEICRIIIEKINFIAMNYVGTQFVISCYAGKLPNSVKATYIYIGIVHPIPEEKLRLVAEERTHEAFQTNTTTGMFTDEIIERNKRFTQKIQVFDNDTEFISRMRAELYNKSSQPGGVAGSMVTLKATSKAPFTTMTAESFVDVDTALPEEPPQTTETAQPEIVGETSFSNPFDRLREVREPLISAAADSAMNLIGNFFKTEEVVENVRPAPQVVPAVPSPRKKDLNRQGVITSPFSRVSAMNPSEEELREIYKPHTIERVVNQRKYLKHIETGYTIPLPPQEPLRRAIELGGKELTTQVQVQASNVAKVTKKVPPPKDVVYEYNMSFSSADNSKR